MVKYSQIGYSAITRNVSEMDKYLSPEQVCELMPGMTPGALAQRRFIGLSPRFLKPSPKRVLYRESDVIEWIEGSERTQTNRTAVA